jgi:hypothetical protein
MQHWGREATGRERDVMRALGRLAPEFDDGLATARDVRSHGQPRRPTGPSPAIFPSVEDLNVGAQTGHTRVACDGRTIYEHQERWWR